MRFSVRLADADESFSCTEQQHLLQGMQAFRIGVPLLQVIPVGCRGGGCGICRIRILSGEYEARKMSRKHVSEHEQADGVALACRIYPRSDLAIELLPLAEDDNKQK